MLTYKHYRSGKLYGIRYVFEYPGDALPEHAHDGTLVHNVIVLSGEVELVFPDGERRIGRAGEIMDFDGARRHRLVALAPSVTLNLMLNGMPPGYDALPESELQGTMPQ